MSAIGRIRKEVLGQSQAELAALTGVAQATVSRWESGELTPGFRELQAIRMAGRSKRPDEWRDEWLILKMSERIGAVRTKIDRKRTMVTATQAQDAVLPKLMALVRLAQSGTGSKMTAYDAVGRRIGASGSWVRKFLGRQPVALEGHVLLNIGAAYARLCSSIEAAADAAEASNALLRGEINAALQTDRPADPRTPGGAPATGAAPRRPGRSPAPALVRALPAPGLPSADDAALIDLPLWRVANEGE